MPTYIYTKRAGQAADVVDDYSPSPSTLAHDLATAFIDSDHPTAKVLDDGDLVIVVKVYGAGRAEPSVWVYKVSAPPVRRVLLEERAF